MSSPFMQRDLGELLGTWPFLRDNLLSSVSQATDALEAQATILGQRREPGAGYAVGSLNFYVWRDIATVPTQVQVTFPAGNRTLAQVVADINADVGVTIAFEDNGFLRLTSPTVGGDSYLRLQSIAGSEGVFSELGLFSETVARGGEVVKAQHVDPSRSVASSGQTALQHGEPFSAALVNRLGLQLGYNSGRSEGAIDLGRRTRLVREVITSTGAVGYQLNASNPSQGVYTGPTATPTADVLEGSIRVLDTDGREFTADRAELTGSIVTTASVGNSTAFDQYLTVTASGIGFAPSDEGRYLVMTGSGTALDGIPVRIVRYDSASIVYVDNTDPSTGLPIVVSPTATGVTVQLADVYHGVRAQVNSFRDSFSAPSTFGTRVEQVSSAVAQASGAVARVERGNRVVVTAGGVDFTSACQPGDLVTWTAAGTTIPWSNDGVYRIKSVVDAQTLELVGQNFEPTILNADSSGGFGNIAVTTDGDFYRAPFIEFVSDVAGNWASGVGAIPPNGTDFVVEYLVQESVRSSFETNLAIAPLNDMTSGDSTSVDVVTRFNREHDSHGNHDTVRPRRIHMRGNTGLAFSMMAGDGEAESTRKFVSQDGSSEVRMTFLANGAAAFGRQANSISNTSFTYGIADFHLSRANSTRDRVVFALGDTTPGSSAPSGIFQKSQIWLQSDENDFSGEFVNNTEPGSSMYWMHTHNHPADGGVGDTGFGIGLASQTTGVPYVNTEAVLKLFFMGLNLAPLTASRTPALDNIMVWGRDGSVGVNLGTSTPAGGTINAAGIPDANLHVRARSVGDLELLRLEGATAAHPTVAMTFKPLLDTAFLGFIEVDESSNDWFMNFGLTATADSESTGSLGVGTFRFVAGAGALGAGNEVARLSSNSSGLMSLGFGFLGSVADSIIPRVHMRADSTFDLVARHIEAVGGTRGSLMEVNHDNYRFDRLHGGNVDAAGTYGYEGNPALGWAMRDQVDQLNNRWRWQWINATTSPAPFADGSWLDVMELRAYAGQLISPTPNRLAVEDGMVVFPNASLSNIAHTDAPEANAVYAVSMSKAWCILEFDASNTVGNPVTIVDGFNVASATLSLSNVVTLTFGTAFANTDFGGHAAIMDNVPASVVTRVLAGSTTTASFAVNDGAAAYAAYDLSSLAGTERFYLEFRGEQ